MRSLLFVEEQVRRAMRSKEADAHLERVDHIAQALPEGRLDGWVLFYRTLLGLEPEGVVDLPDPTVSCAAKRCPIGNARSASP